MPIRTGPDADRDDLTSADVLADAGLARCESCRTVIEKHEAENFLCGACALIERLRFDVEQAEQAVALAKGMVKL